MVIAAHLQVWIDAIDKIVIGVGRPIDADSLKLRGNIARMLKSVVAAFKKYSLLRIHQQGFARRNIEKCSIEVIGSGDYIAQPNPRVPIIVFLCMSVE